MLKLLFQGAQGVGKTTIVNAINNLEVHSLKILSRCEVARNLIKKGISQGNDTKENDYFVYLFAYANSFRTATGDIQIFDRSIIDAVIYSRLSFGKENIIYQLSYEMWKYIEHYVHTIFYIPVEFTLVPDGIRNPDSNNQKEFDLELKRFLTEEVSVPVITLKGDVESRKKQALESITQLLAKK